MQISSRETKTTMNFIASRVRTLATNIDAFASCWIRDGSIQEALQLLPATLVQYGYEVDQVLDAKTISRDNYDEGDEGLQYYEQAMIDDVVVVFYTAAD